ncbi:MAG: fibrobacter succinogenes major paralogous domain-containing protein [Bacteroidales bacterium]|nr:fibrobacter succinogenes major paralogous domain-containing protein [Bacteroidales bacterium]
MEDLVEIIRLEIIPINMHRLLRKSVPLILVPGIVHLISSCNEKQDSTTVGTSEITVITQTRAVSGGYVYSRNNRTVSSRGVCWSTTANPTILDYKTSNGKDTGNFISIITGLRPNTAYYLRAYITNTKDTLYGEIKSFTTPDYGSVRDIEGNEYKTITIGTQTWMLKNLCTTRFKDDTPIAQVSDSAKWASITTPAYCWYKNDEAAFESTYGALYNWFTVNTGKLCPEGWHAPSDDEWNILTSIYGGEKVAGGKLKERGMSYWVDPNSGATNESGFTALPGGFRYHDGVFFDLGFGGYWWSTEQHSTSDAFFRFIYYKDSAVFRFNNRKRNGFSVRCVRDKETILPVK